MKRVAGYARVSTVGQAKDGTSLEDQRDIIEEKCKQEGLKLEKFFSDGGASGGSLERPELQALISDAEKGLFDTIMFTKLDRLGRNIRDTLNLWHKLHEELHLEIICVKDPIVNTDGIMGKAMFSLIAIFAELERGMIRERTQAGRKIKWEKGDAYFGELPLGYIRSESGKVIIEEEHAQIYHKVVDLYLNQRLSTKKIALELTRAGIPTPSAIKKKKIQSSRWNGISVVDMLKNPAYKGEKVCNKEIYRHKLNALGKKNFDDGKTTKPESEWITFAFDPLITPEKWQQIQDRMQAQKLKPKRVYKGYEDHFLFDGFLYCGECGSRMRKRVKVEKDNDGKQGKVRLYYTCCWHGVSADIKEIAGRKSCYLEAVNADQTDDKLFNQIIDLLTRPTYFVSAWLKDLNTEELEKKVALLEQKSKQLNKRLLEGYNLIASTENSGIKKIYEEGRQKDQKEWGTVQADLTDAKRELDHSTNKKDRYKAFCEAMKKSDPKGKWKLQFSTKGGFSDFMHSLPFAEKKRIVETIVSPEQGGKCFVQYVRPIDFLDSDELKEIPKEKWNAPLTDREPYPHGDFMFDLDRVESVINSLKDKSLLSKVYADPPAGRGKYAH
ncbi:MAG: recombinase family protein [Deltaproteobacteria bacterium]|nr:recombinase family protein [Deltaproteobacteria bacterium]